MKKIIIDNLDKIETYQKYIIEDFKKEKQLNIELHFESDFLNTNIIRDFISFLCDWIWIEALQKFKIILVVDELNNNAIEYWSKNWEINKLRFKVTNHWKNILFLEVEDTWNWAFHKTASEMIDIEKQKIIAGFNNWIIRWRWLLIVKNIVDKLYFRDSITWWLIVWVEKNIKLQKNW